jgi:hypothetical protein
MSTNLNFIGSMFNSQDYLQRQYGLDTSMMSTTPQIIGDINNNDAGNQNIQQSGSYEIHDQNGRGGDTLEIGNQHNIFADLLTDQDDQVKLDGPGWEIVNDPSSTAGVDLWINKQTNSAVMVNSGTTVSVDSSFSSNGATGGSGGSSGTPAPPTTTTH